MKLASLTITGELTDLNAYIKAMNSNRFAGNGIKQYETDRVVMEANKQRVPSIDTYPVHIVYRWYPKDRKKDVDNIVFGKKFINDGLVRAGVLENDSQKYLSGMSDFIEVDRNKPRVEVEIYTGVSLHENI